MGSSRLFIAFSLLLLFAVVRGGHDHHSHYNDYRTSESTSETYTSDRTTLSPLSQNGTSHLELRDRVKLGLGALISIPVVGLIVLLCCCYCCCKYCCCENGDKAQNIIVMQSNNVQEATIAPPPPTQVFIQQPIYQQHQQPIYQQPVPPPYAAWGDPKQPMPEPQYYPQSGYSNPSFACPTAPVQYTPEKY